MTLLPRLAMLVLAPILLGVAVLVWQTLDAERAREAAANAQASQEAAETAASLGRALEARRSALRALAATPGLAAATPEARRRMLAAWERGVPEFGALQWHEPLGDILTAREESEPVRVPGLAAELRLDRPSLARPQLSSEGSRPALLLVVPVSVPGFTRPGALGGAVRLPALLNDLLDLSQMDTVGAHAFPLGPVDLGEVMQRAVQVVLVPGGGREIRVTAPPAATWVRGHGAKLEQVLINLLSNALKYSPDGGPVTLAAASTAQGIAVAVTDQGLGLTEDQQAKLFTRFFRADPSGPIPGTGLGLVIVKELVERMGGRVEVRSRPGEGSTFTVHLCLAGAPDPAGLAPPAP